MVVCAIASDRKIECWARKSLQINSKIVFRWTNLKMQKEERKRIVCQQRKHLSFSTTIRLFKRLNVIVIIWIIIFLFHKQRHYFFRCLNFQMNNVEFSLSWEIIDKFAKHFVLCVSYEQLNESLKKGEGILKLLLLKLKVTTKRRICNSLNLAVTLYFPI